MQENTNAIETSQNKNMKKIDLYFSISEYNFIVGKLRKRFPRETRIPVLFKRLVREFARSEYKSHYIKNIKPISICSQNHPNYKPSLVFDEKPINEENYNELIQKERLKIDSNKIYTE